MSILKKIVQFVKDFAWGIGAALAVLLLVIFAAPLSNNLHNFFLQFLSSRVVMLTNEAGNSGATGWIVEGASGKKYIMTNGHVCGLADASGTLVAHYDGTKFPVTVAKKYVWNDLCALEAHRPLGRPFKIAHQLLKGETVWAIGHPLLEPTTVTVGELSGTAIIQIMVGTNVKPEECNGPTYRIFDLSGTLYALVGMQNACVRTLESMASTIVILPGNSGSPAVNAWGRVVAVAFAGNEAGTRTYFVPLEDLKDFLSEL